MPPDDDDKTTIYATAPFKRVSEITHNHPLAHSILKGDCILNKNAGWRLPNVHHRLTLNISSKNCGHQNGKLDYSSNVRWVQKYITRNSTPSSVPSSLPKLVLWSAYFLKMRSIVVEVGSILRMAIISSCCHRWRTNKLQTQKSHRWFGPLQAPIIN